MRAAPLVVPRTSCKHSDFFLSLFLPFLQACTACRSTAWTRKNGFVVKTCAGLSHCQIQLADVVMFNTAKTSKPSLTTEAKFSWQQMCLEVCENCWVGARCVSVCALLSRLCECSARLFVSYHKRGCALPTCTFSTQLNGPCKIIKCPFTVAGTQQ